ncbi:hypothetical protein [Niveispirillum sp. KHB5.9]|uniref:hypothetical protein n=1 Tax=Niveispirillum sp. KHB5.9 TaxID=3400269 RepID=UPI003A8C64F8
MRYAYPYVLTEEGGFWMARCPDVRGAATDDREKAEAVSELPDALVAALGAVMELGQPIPIPGSACPPGQVITLPPLAAAKLALYETMRARGMNNSELARQLGLQENAVRRLLDLDHRSHIDSVQEALAVLGRRLVVEDVPLNAA